MDNQLTTEQFKELDKTVKLQIEIDGHCVYVTDVSVYNDKLKVVFFCKDEKLEEQLTPHVHDCILGLIREQEQKAPKKRFWEF